MKYSFLILFLITPLLYAKECSLVNDYFTLDSENTQQVATPSRMMLRIAKINITGRYSLENLETYVTETVDDIEVDGISLSLVGGVSSNIGFDFRPLVTLQLLHIIESGDDLASNMTLLGEFEFAYNINNYFSPFIGFNAGVGITDFDNKNTDAGYGAQFSLLLGLNGQLYEDIGYFTKLSATIKTSYFTHEDTNFYMSSKRLAIEYGLSYKF